MELKLSEFRETRKHLATSASLSLSFLSGTANRQRSTGGPPRISAGATAHCHVRVFTWAFQRLAWFFIPPLGDRLLRQKALETTTLSEALLVLFVSLISFAFSNSPLRPR